MTISRFPPWFDASIDYTAPRYHEAVAFGRQAANSSTCEWDKAETSLMEVWSLSPRQGKWSDVRGAVFYAWDEARLSFSAQDEDDDWSNDIAGF